MKYRFTIKNIYIFSELNERSIVLAEYYSFKADGQVKRKPAIIFAEANRDEIRADLLNRAEIIGAGLSKGSVSSTIESLAFSRMGTPIKVFLMHDETKKNSLNADNAIRIVERFNNTKVKLDVFAFSMQEDTEKYIDSLTVSENITLRSINEIKYMAETLFDKKPLYMNLTKYQRKMSLLMLGGGSVGKEVIKTALWCGQVYGTSLEVRLISLDAMQIKKELEFSCPDIFKYSYLNLDCDNPLYKIEFEELDARTSELKSFLDKTEGINYIVVALGSDDLNLEVATKLRSYYVSKSIEKNQENEPFIAVNIDSAEKSRSLLSLKTCDKGIRNQFNLYPFGNKSMLYRANFAALKREKQAICLNYAIRSKDEFSEEKLNETLSGVTYDRLKFPKDERSADIREKQASAIGMKTRIFEAYSFGADEKLISPAEEPYEWGQGSDTVLTLNKKDKLWKAQQDDFEQVKTLKKLFFDQIKWKEKIEVLAQMEHRRWVSYMRTEGYVGYNGKELSFSDNLYRTEGDGSNKLTLAFKHADITDWDNLSQSQKAKFRAIVSAIPSVWEYTNQK